MQEHAGKTKGCEREARGMGRKRTKYVDEERMARERKGVCAQKTKSVSREPHPRRADGQEVRMSHEHGRKTEGRTMKAGCVCWTSWGS